MDRPSDMYLTISISFACVTVAGNGCVIGLLRSKPGGLSWSLFQSVFQSLLFFGCAFVLIGAPLLVEILQGFRWCQLCLHAPSS